MIKRSRIGRVSTLWAIWMAIILLAGCGGTPTAVPHTGAPAMPASSAVTISRLEVTQGLDRPGTLLVSGRSTAIVAHLQAADNAISVSGTLGIKIDGQSQLDRPAIGPVTLSTASGGKGQLVFEPLFLPKSGNVEFLVTVKSDTASAQVLASQVITAQFTQATVTPYLFYVPINFMPSQQGAPPSDLIGPPNGDAFARAVLPIGGKNWYYRAVNDQEIQGASSGPIAPIEIKTNDRPCDCGDSTCKKNACQTQIDGDTKLNFAWPKEYLVVFRRLSNIRQRIQLPSGVGMNELLFVHGWIYDPDAPDIVENNGAAIATGERVGYGTTSPSLGQLIYAHELLHNLLDPTTSLGLPDLAAALPIAQPLGWDVGSQLPGAWVGVGVGGQRKENYYPIMAHRTTGNSWISQAESDYAIAYFGSTALLNLVTGFPACPETPVVGQPCLSAGNYVFSGVLDAGGPLTITMLKELKEVQLTGVFPVSVIPWPTQPTYTYSNYARGGLPFNLVFRRGEETIAKIPFDPSVTTFVDAEAAQKAGGTDYLGYFEVVVPPSIAKQTDNVQIEIAATQQRLTFLDEKDYAENLAQLPIVQTTPLRVGD